MTKNEIKWNLDGVIKYLYKKNELGGDDSEKQYQVDNSTIDLLEELQQYRAIGTVGRFQQLTKQFKPHVTDKTSCPHRGCNKCDMYRKENEKYHEIGTVEECREARERQIPIKPKGIYKTRYIWDSAYCPVCGCGITARWNFCQSCGQAISWESDTP